MRKTSTTNSHGSRRPKDRMFVHRAAIRDDLGQAFVELALILPIFILLLVGIAEFGRLAYAAIEVSNAARAGVAYGAQNHTTASDNSGIQTAAVQDAPNIPGLIATATQVCSCDGSSISCSSAGTSCISPARIIESVQVNTSAVVDTVFHFPGFPNTITLRGQAIMRVEQ